MIEKRSVEAVLASIGVTKDTPEMIEARKKSWETSDYKMLLTVLVMGQPIGAVLRTTPDYLWHDIKATIDTQRLAETDAGASFPIGGFTIAVTPWTDENGSE